MSAVLAAGRDYLGEKHVEDRQIEAELAAVSAAASLRTEIEVSAENISAMNKLNDDHSASLLRAPPPDGLTGGGTADSVSALPAVAAAESGGVVIPTNSGGRARAAVVIPSTGLTKGRSGGAGSSLARSPHPVPVRAPVAPVVVRGRSRGHSKAKLKTQTESRVVTGSAASGKGVPRRTAISSRTSAAAAGTRPKTTQSSRSQPFSVHDTNVVSCMRKQGATADWNDSGSICSMNSDVNTSDTTDASSATTDSQLQNSDELVDASRLIIEQIRQRLQTPVAVPVSVSADGNT